MFNRRPSLRVASISSSGRRFLQPGDGSSAVFVPSRAARGVQFAQPALLTAVRHLCPRMRSGAEVFLPEQPMRNDASITSHHLYPGGFIRNGRVIEMDHLYPGADQ